MVDEFQHIMYAEPDLTPGKRVGRGRIMADIQHRGKIQVHPQVDVYKRQELMIVMEKQKSEPCLHHIIAMHSSK